MSALSFPRRKKDTGDERKKRTTGNKTKSPPRHTYQHGVPQHSSFKQRRVHPEQVRREEAAVGPADRGGPARVREAEVRRGPQRRDAVADVERADPPWQQLQAALAVALVF